MKPARHPETAGMGAGARRTLYRYVVVPSWVTVGVLTLVFAAGIEVSGPVQYAPFAFSLIFFGLPHGAVDHLVPGRLSGAGISARPILAVVFLYGVLSSVYLAVWYALPASSFVFFILLTWFHWGQGDLYSTAALLQGRHLSSKTLKFLTVVTRGGLPMLVPLLAFPEVYAKVARGAVALFSANTDVSWLSNPTFRVAAGLAYVFLVLFTLAWGHAAAPRSGLGWWRDALEIGMLAGYFSVVPPVFALGMYFSLWHAPRHVARLMLLDKNSEAFLEKGEFRPALKNFVRDATPLTLVAALLLAGLYLAVPGSVEGAAGLLALYLVLISVLTLPHVAVVAVMDLKQGLWR